MRLMSKERRQALARKLSGLTSYYGYGAPI
jgi:hypothetical protein